MKPTQSYTPILYFCFCSLDDLETELGSFVDQSSERQLETTILGHWLEVQKLVAEICMALIHVWFSVTPVISGFQVSRLVFGIHELLITKEENARE